MGACRKSLAEGRDEQPVQVNLSRRSEAALLPLDRAQRLDCRNAGKGDQDGQGRAQNGDSSGLPDARVRDGCSVTGARRGRDVVLHLGMLKTGSASIQAACDGYADGTTSYLPNPHPNHSYLLALAFDEDIRLTREETKVRDALRVAMRDQLAATLDAVASRSVLLSAESLSSFRNTDGYHDCAAFLQDRVGLVRAIAYIRDPASFSASLFCYMTRIEDAPFDAFAYFPRYRDHFAVWEEALEGRVEYVLFDPSAFHRGDLLEDFALRAGIDRALMRNLPKRSNVSLSAETTSVLVLLREIEAPALDRLAALGQVKRLQRLLRDFGSQRFAFASGQMDPAMEFHADQVAWMEARLGCRMPRSETRGVEFASRADLLAFGRSLGPALSDHLARHRALKPTAGDEAQTLLLRLVDRLGRVPS